jgi:hypothetical protein
MAWAFPKGSPYYDIINHQIFMMKESGLMKNLMQKQVIFSKFFSTFLIESF